MQLRGSWLVALLTLAVMPIPSLAQVPLIPLPAQIVPRSGSFLVTSATGISASDAAATNAARLLIERTAKVRGLPLRLVPNGAIRFERDPSVRGDEAYSLSVTAAGIRVSASGNAGFVYGAMTLAQLMSPDMQRGNVTIPAMDIFDAPRFRWRGYMADPARHFQPISELYKTIDQMVSLKLNILHLHLSDDQGWRVEIKRYPKLTSVGAWRSQPTAGGAPSPKLYGGYYTQAQLKSLVAYAAQRAITIVPEIDLPGHAQAIIAAYPEFGTYGDRPPVSGDWGVGPYLLDPGPKGVQFVKDVIDELLAIFPSPYFHLGGDEAVKDQWERSPNVQALMAAKGIKTANALQSDLIRQFDTYLLAKGRRLIGWDEILDGGDLPTSAVVMSWQGERGAIAASKLGHDVILSPAPILYLDNIQSWLPDEPPMRPANPPMTLEKIYGYDAMPKEIASADRRHVLGAQVNGWSEYLTSPARVDWALYPRIAAFAEGAWSPASARDFRDFLTRLEPQFARWRADGIAPADSAFAVAYTLDGIRSAAIGRGSATVALANQAGYGTIRYTLDGSTPTAASPVYDRPLTSSIGTTIRAATFGTKGLMLSRTRDYSVSRDALLAAATTDLSACKGGIELRFGLTPDATAFGPAYNSNIFDPCLTWKGAPLSAARGYLVSVGRLPRNLGLIHDFDRPRGYYPATQFGELLVRAGGCQGRPVGAFPLPDPATAPNRLSFTGELPVGMPDGDLCMIFTAPIAGPIYSIDAMQLR